MTAFGEEYARGLAAHNSGDIPARMGLYGVPLEPGMTALEVGCGYGRCVEGLRARGLDAIGADINAWLIEHLDKPYLQWGDVRDLDFADNAFDLVVCTDVLEHVAEYETAIDELVRVSRRLVYVEVTTTESRNMHLDPTHCVFLDRAGWQAALAARAEVVGHAGGFRFLLRKRGT
jgi:ubiquinone/menaquinone biosynthesis C-methylase UbiE